MNSNRRSWLEPTAQDLRDLADYPPRDERRDIVDALKNAWQCVLRDQPLPGGRCPFRFTIVQEDIALLQASSGRLSTDALQELTRPSKLSMSKVNGKMYIKALTLVLEEQSPVSINRIIVRDRDQPHYDNLSDLGGLWQAPVVFIASAVRIIVFLTDSTARGCPDPLQKSERLAVLRMLRSYEERYARMNLGGREYFILSVQYGFARWVKFERRGLEIAVRTSQWFDMSNESHLATVHHLVTRAHAHGQLDATRYHASEGRVVLRAGT